MPFYIYEYRHLLSIETVFGEKHGTSTRPRDAVRPGRGCPWQGREGEQGEARPANNARRGRHQNQLGSVSAQKQVQIRLSNC